MWITWFSGENPFSRFLRRIPNGGACNWNGSETILHQYSLISGAYEPLSASFLIERSWLPERFNSFRSFPRWPIDRPQLGFFTSSAISAVLVSSHKLSIRQHKTLWFWIRTADWNRPSNGRLKVAFCCPKSSRIKSFNTAPEKWYSLKSHKKSNCSNSIVVNRTVSLVELLLLRAAYGHLLMTTFGCLLTVACLRTPGDRAARPLQSRQYRQLTSFSKFSFIFQI